MKNSLLVIKHNYVLSAIAFSSRNKNHLSEIMEIVVHIDVNINLKPTDGTNPGKQQCSSKGKAMTFSTSYPKPRHQNLPYTITSEQLIESISINKVNKSLSYKSRSFIVIMVRSSHENKMKNILRIKSRII